MSHRNTTPRTDADPDGFVEYVRAEMDDFLTGHGYPPMTSGERHRFAELYGPLVLRIHARDPGASVDVLSRRASTAALALTMRLCFQLDVSDASTSSLPLTH